MHSRKELEAHQVEKGLAELRQGCTIRECSVRLDNGRESESS